MDNSDLVSESSIVDHEQLRAFIAFAERLNFTHAARDIGLSQPALHERIRRLGDHLEVPLYRRQGRALELTPEGEEVLAFARQSLSRSTSLVRRLRGQQDAHEVVLAAGEGSYLFLLSSALKAFAKKRAEESSRLTLLTLGGPSTLAAIRSGRAHVGVGVFDVIPRGITFRPIVTTTLCAAMHHKNTLAGRKRVTLAQLADQRLILAPEGQKHRDIISRAVAATLRDDVNLPRPMHPPITADGWPLMLAFAGMGLGVAVVNGTCKPAKGIVLVPIPELGSISYRVVWRRDAPDSAAREQLVELICQSYQ